jgi:SnoaL-like protein
MSDARSDADQIRDLLSAYCWHMDRGEFDALGALFEHASMGDGTAPDAPVLTGSEMVAALYRDRCILYDDGTPRTKHVCANAIVEFGAGGTVATSRSYFLVEQQFDDFPLQPIVGGRYHDRFERVGDEWRFTERRFFVDLVGDTSRHQRAALR